jgi:hypothetical protein
MTGAKGGDMRGIIPRSVEQIIQQVMLMRESGWEIVVNASMVSLYELSVTKTIVTNCLSLIVVI